MPCFRSTGRCWQRFRRNQVHVPGVIWGYLYWRPGFVAAEIASVGTHPFLQPALGILLAR